MPQSVQVHIIGASGRTGVALCRSLVTDAMPLVPVVRNVEKWAATGIDVAPHIADLGNPATLHSALESATHIVCCAHAHHAGVVIEAAPVDARLIFLGSTRKFTKWLDAHGSRRAGRRACIPGLGSFRSHAAPNDDLRRTG